MEMCYCTDDSNWQNSITSRHIPICRLPYLTVQHPGCITYHMVWQNCIRIDAFLKFLFFTCNAHAITTFHHYCKSQLLPFSSACWPTLWKSSSVWHPVHLRKRLLVQWENIFKQVCDINGDADKKVTSVENGRNMPIATLKVIALSAFLKILFHFHFLEGTQQRWQENQGNCWLMWTRLPLHWIAAGAVVSKQIHPTSFRWKPHTQILEDMNHTAAK